MKSSISNIFGEQVKKYVLGDCISGIGDDAFRGCKSLTSISIPNSVTSIGAAAFCSCSGLSSISIPESVVVIGESAFSGCYGLKKVIVNDIAGWCGIEFGDYLSNPTFYTRNIFSDENTIITNLVVPEGVTSIGAYAFQDCSSLKSIIIPESVSNIGAYAFQNCERLADIYVASSEPVDCDGINTFESINGGIVRDKYDVYNYAVLHVPMGSKENYAAAYEWRYFSKIKEDMEINGKVFYTTLSVNQAGEGYVKHYVKADEPYTIFIGSDEGLRINTVMFNGDDVTDKLVDGYYTTPNITHPSKISISFEQTIDDVKGFAMENNLHVYGNDGSLFVSGITNPQRLSVYSLNGALIETQELG